MNRSSGGSRPGAHDKRGGWSRGLSGLPLHRLPQHGARLMQVALLLGGLGMTVSCAPEPPLLTIALAGVENPGNLEGVTSFTFRAEYQTLDGAVVKRLGPFTFVPEDVSDLQRLDIETTQPNQRLVVTLEAYGPLDGSSGLNLLARAQSAPFEFTEAGPGSVTLLLGRIQHFNQLADSLKTPRIGHVVIPMGSGGFLVAGGAGDDGQASGALEILDNGDTSLNFGLSAATASLKQARAGLIGGRFFSSGTAVAEQGSIFLAGGDSATRLALVRHTYLDPEGVEQSILAPDLGLSLSSIDTYDSVERFDPATGSLTAMNPLPHARSMTPSLTLSDGAVLFCGGLEQLQPADASLSLTSSCFRYSSGENGSWAAAGVLSNSVVLHQLTAMDNGYLLSSGGLTSHELLSTDEAGVLTVNVSATADLMGPGGALKYSGLMKDARAAHSVVWLPRETGQALVTGGYGRTVSERLQYPRLLDSAELFDRYTAESGVASRAFVRLSAHLNYARAFHSTVALEDGRVLILGGIGADPDLPLPAEIIDPASEDPIFEIVSDSTLPPLLMHAVVPLSDSELAVVGGMSFDSSGANALEAQTVRVWVTE